MPYTPIALSDSRLNLPIYFFNECYVVKCKKQKKNRIFECPNVFKLSGWSIGVNTYRMYIPNFWTIFDPAHYNPMGGITLLSISFEPKVIDILNEYQRVCLVIPNRMIPKMTQLWPDLTCDPKLCGRSNFEIVFLGGCKVGYHSICLNERNTMISILLL